ncbi:MAG TPA: hypothetical protein VLV17_03300 [Anaeromyxobacteraceae bacterium]|nr:hypothetical protein [Anaeromyxobacteraceae bacterium]
MDPVDQELLAAEADALFSGLALERHRHVAGLVASPDLASHFSAHARAAHRETVKALGEADLAAEVARLRVERVQAASEEAWRAEEAKRTIASPDGVVSFEEGQLALVRERDRGKRLILGREVARAARLGAREAAVEERARARAELGLTPDWEAVVAADEVLSASDDAYQDVLGWLFRREASLPPPPAGDPERSDLLFVLALPSFDGVFPRGALEGLLRETAGPLRLQLDEVNLEEGARPAQWPGAHAHGVNVSLRRQGGAADYLGLFEAVGQAIAAARAPAHRRPPAATFTGGTLLAHLLLDPGFLLSRLRVDKKRAGDLVRALSLRELFRLRARAAACRVASEVERGMSGSAWHEAHREALSRATLVAWPLGLCARDGDAGALAAALLGAAQAERERAVLVERFDEDWWKNPRSAAELARLLAQGFSPGKEAPPLALSARALVAKL